MRARKDIDPELHVLKSLGMLIPEGGRERQQWEAARFNLYAAFEERSPARARRWAGALAVALEFVPEGVRDRAHGALEVIEKAIEETAE